MTLTVTLRENAVGPPIWLSTVDLPPEWCASDYGVFSMIRS